MTDRQARLALYREIVGQAWAMEPTALQGLVRTVTGADGGSGLKPAAEACERFASAQPYITKGGTAVIPIVGVMVKEVPWFYDLFGIEATATTRVEAALSAAVAEDDVERILLAIQSPGGQVAGTQELAAAVYGARQAKPISAAIEDLGASAAYWVASQAQSITANPTAAVGSIGVYMVLDDVSGAFEKQGIKTHVIASGPDKGVGVYGAPIAEEQLGPFREEVEQLADIFVGDVARGRGMTEGAVKEWATGRTWLAGEALAYGLIDRVEFSGETLGALEGC